MRSILVKSCLKNLSSTCGTSMSAWHRTLMCRCAGSARSSTIIGLYGRSGGATRCALQYGAPLLSKSASCICAVWQSIHLSSNQSSSTLIPLFSNSVSPALKALAACVAAFFGFDPLFSAISMARSTTLMARYLRSSWYMSSLSFFPS